MQHPGVNAVVFYAVVIFFEGLSTTALGIFTSDIGMQVCAILFGFTYAVGGMACFEGIVVLTGHELSSLWYWC